MPSRRAPGGRSAATLSRRAALRDAGLAGPMLLLPSVASPLALLSGCGPVDGDPDRNRYLVLALAFVLLPYTETPGASTEENADFVMRAVAAGMMGVRADILDRLAEDLAKRSGGTFMTLPTARQEQVIAQLDAQVFAAAVPQKHPWYAVKALIMMSYYTSIGGMSEELRYELAPGRYDNDVMADTNWKPLSNDWAAVSVKKPIIA